MEVTATVSFEPDRSMRISLTGPEGTVDVAKTRSSADVGRLIQEAAERLYGDRPLQIDVSVQQPPWLQVGTIVQLAAGQIDPAEQIRDPHAQVVGFLPIGGVMAVHPQTGTGIWAPEHLSVVDPATLPLAVLEGIVQRTGLTPP